GEAPAIFSMANAALLRPLPYPHSENLWTVLTKFTDGRVTSGLVGPVEFTRLKDPTLPIMNVALSFHQDLTLLRSDGTPQAIVGSGVDEGFFSLFGVPLIVGCGLTPQQFHKNETAADAGS